MRIFNKSILRSFHLDPKDLYSLVQKWHYMTPLKCSYLISNNDFFKTLV